MLLVSRFWVFCNLQYQLTFLSDFILSDFLDVDIHQTIWFESKCLKMSWVIQILYFIISNIFQNHWFLTTCEIFWDVDRHQLKKQEFGRHFFSCFACSCFIIIFLLHHLIFIFVSYLFVYFVFFQRFTVLIPKIFH